MEEGTPPAPAETSAPVAESAPVEAAPEVEVSSESASTEATEAIETAETTGAPETTATPELPGADDFGWDDWDGDHGGLPEHVSPWAERVASHHKTKFESALSDKDKDYEVLSKLYNDYLLTGEDPRVAELTASGKEWEEKFNTLTSEFDSYRSGIEAQLETDAKEWADTFIAQHRDVLQGENIEKFQAAMAAGWEPDDIVVYLTLPPEAQAEGEAALKAGTPSSFALKLAQKSVEYKSTPEPRAASHIVSGADVGSRPSKSTRALGDIKSLDERRKLVSERAIRKSKSGRSR